MFLMQTYSFLGLFVGKSMQQALMASQALPASSEIFLGNIEKLFQHNKLCNSVASVSSGTVLTISLRGDCHQLRMFW